MLFTNCNEVKSCVGLLNELSAGIGLLITGRGSD
uniref:Transcriptional regulator n=1 Tax=Schistosoma curassoni TaxID=6186 RepID=A0A183L412_9TREM